jgi:hypothetical protein
MHRMFLITLASTLSFTASAQIYTACDQNALIHADGIALEGGCKAAIESSHDELDRWIAFHDADCAAVGGALHLDVTTHVPGIGTCLFKGGFEHHDDYLPASCVCPVPEEDKRDRARNAPLFLEDDAGER